MKDYTFTNGTSVNEWLDTLAAEDKLVAIKCIKQMIAEGQPLNLLQVKIRMTSTRPDSEYVEEAIRREQESIGETAQPQQQAPPQQPLTPDGNPDYYNAPPVTPQMQGQHASHETRKKSRSKVWLYILIGVLALAVVAVGTNPPKEKHMELMSSTITNAAADVMKEQVQQTQIGGMFGSMIFDFFSSMGTPQMIEGIINDFLQNNLEYHDYIVCSTCTVKLDDEVKTVSFGIFGKVFTFDENDIRKAINENAPKQEAPSFNLFSFPF